MESGECQIRQVATDSISVVSEHYEICFTYGDYANHIDTLVFTYFKDGYIKDCKLVAYPNDHDCPYQQMEIRGLVRDDGNHNNNVDFKIRTIMLELANSTSIINLEISKSFDSAFTKLGNEFAKHHKGD